MNEKIGWSHPSYLEKVKAQVPEEQIYSTDNNCILFEARDFKTSEQLGSPMWCITRDEKYFEEYTEEMERIVFMYDFNKSPEDNSSQVAFIVEPNGIISSGYYKDDTSMKVDIFPSIEKEIPKISKDFIEHKLDILWNDFTDIYAKKNIFNTILLNDYPEIIENRFGKDTLKSFLTSSFANSGAKHVAFSGAKNSFNFLNNYFLNDDTDPLLRGSWTTSGITYILNAVKGEHIDFAHEIFNMPHFKDELKIMNDEPQVIKAPNKIVTEDSINTEEQLKKEKLALYIMQECELHPEDCFPFTMVKKSIFDFYHKNFPDFVNSLKESPTIGFIYISNLTENIKDVPLEDKLSIIDKLNLNSEQKQKFKKPLEEHFTAALLPYSARTNINKIINDYRVIFEKFENNNFEKALKEDIVKNHVIAYSDFELLDSLKKQKLIEHFSFSKEDIKILKEAINPKIPIFNYNFDLANEVVEKIEKETLENKSNKKRLTP